MLEVGESETPRVREPSSPRRDVSFGSFPLLDETRHVSKIVPAQRPWIELRRSLSIEKPLLRLVSQRKCNQPSLFSSQTDEPDSKPPPGSLDPRHPNYQSSIIDKPLIAFAGRTRAPERRQSGVVARRNRSSPNVASFLKPVDNHVAWRHPGPTRHVMPGEPRQLVC